MILSQGTTYDGLGMSIRSATKKCTRKLMMMIDDDDEISNLTIFFLLDYVASSSSSSSGSFCCRTDKNDRACKSNFQLNFGINNKNKNNKNKDKNNKNKKNKNKCRSGGVSQYIYVYERGVRGVRPRLGGQYTASFLVFTSGIIVAYVAHAKGMNARCSKTS